MIKRLKKIIKSKTFIFILGGILCSTITAYAVTYFPSNQVTYDNSTSKLNSTNVQGAIDELYKTCSSAQISGDYIYIYADIDYGEGKGFYRIPIKGGTATKIQEDNSGPYNNMHYTPYAEDFIIYKDYIYFYADTNVGTGIFRIPISGGKSTQIQEDNSGPYNNMHYTPYAENLIIHGDYIYFYANTTLVDGPGIYRISILGGKTTKIQENSSNNIYYNKYATKFTIY